jgi:hypothetical protein
MSDILAVQIVSVEFLVESILFNVAINNFLFCGNLNEIRWHLSNPEPSDGHSDLHPISFGDGCRIASHGYDEERKVR